MNDDERKQRFIALLEELLKDCDGVKTQLANNLGIKPSTLTRWFQGQIDPASIELVFFIHLAEKLNLSTDELVKNLGILEKSEFTILDKFKTLIRDLLSTQTQQLLAKKLGVSEGAVGTWVRKQRTVDPRKISIATIAAIAREKNWTIERLLIYLDLKKTKNRDNLSSRLKTDAMILSLQEQVDLLVWLSTIIDQRVKESENIPQINNSSNKNTNNISDRTVCIILETENLAIASNYASNLVLHLSLKPENIKVTTIPNLPESIADIDILIFDISSPESASIALIKDIEFDRNIIVFIDADLPVEVRSHLESKVADVVVKPIDWQRLKDKA